MPEKNRLIQEVKKFVQNVEPKVEEAYLFGSQARRDALKESDVDVVLVSEGFQALPFWKRMSQVSQFWQGPQALEALCYTRKEFEKKKNQISIVRQAVLEGIRIK